MEEFLGAIREAISLSCPRDPLNSRKHQIYLTPVIDIGSEFVVLSWRKRERTECFGEKDRLYWGTSAGNDTLEETAQHEIPLLLVEA